MGWFSKQAPKDDAAVGLLSSNTSDNTSISSTDVVEEHVDDPKEEINMMGMQKRNVNPVGNLKARQVKKGRMLKSEAHNFEAFLNKAPQMNVDPHWSIPLNSGKTILANITAAIHVCCALAYLIYRGMFTIGGSDVPYDVYTYQVVFFTAEVLSVSSFFFGWLERMKPIKRECVPLKECTPKIAPEDYPTIAVMIPTYNESIEILAQTLRGAMCMDYPQEHVNIFICDDSRRKNVYQWVQALKEVYPNIFYINRNVKKHAKAGNINNAVDLTDSDLLLILDADFIPSRHFLQKTVPYFYRYNEETMKLEFDPTVGFVQTPQFYGNIDPSEDPIDLIAKTFFELLIPGRDGIGATPCIGTNFVASRAAFESIGGFPTGSVTEDCYLSMLMEASGYKCMYVSEYLATGYSPTTLADTFRQRSRWCKGSYQIFFSKDCPLWLSGLPFWTRMAYIAVFVNYSTAWLSLFFTISIPVFLIGHYVPLNLVNYIDFLIVLLFYLGSGLLYETVVHSGLSRPYASTQMFSIGFQYYIMKNFVVALLGGNLTFKVTRKSTDDKDDKAMLRQELYKSLRRIRYNVAVIFLLLFSVVWGLVYPYNLTDAFGQPIIGGRIFIAFSISTAFYFMFNHLCFVYWAFHPIDVFHPSPHWVTFFHVMSTLTRLTGPVLAIYFAMEVYRDNLYL
eukprot:Clim_evm2s173 gene=Clim_evmTU2s173